MKITGKNQCVMSKKSHVCFAMIPSQICVICGNIVKQHINLTLFMSSKNLVSSNQYTHMFSKKKCSK